MLTDRIYLSPPHMGSRELNYVREAFESNWISPVGPHLKAFENEMCEYLGLPQGSCLALSSGTAAIHLALRLAGVGSGDIVPCSTLTFAASAFPIVYQSALPLFVDSEVETWNMCPVALERSLEKLKQSGTPAKAVMAVSLYGQSFQADRIRELCRHYNAVLIEDSAEALGASYQGHKCATLGEYGILSFNGNKIITTSGGGMLVCRDKDQLARAQKWSTQSRESHVSHYEHTELGYNYRLSNVLAGIGRGQLGVLDERVQARRKIFDQYQQCLADVSEISFMPEAKHSYSNRWLTVIRMDPKCGKTPLSLTQYLDSLNIEARPVWKPMHQQPLFSHADLISSQEKALSDTLYLEGACLPSGSSLSISQVEYICDEIKSFLRS